MKWTKLIAIIVFLSFTTSLYGQDGHRKNYFPIWTFHQDSITIHGLSLGFWSVNHKHPKRTYTNGVKLELIGVGWIIPLIPKSPIVTSDSDFIRLQQEPLSEHINGLNLSASGSFCQCRTNGLTAGLMGQIHFQVNGISTTLFLNLIQKHNGLMLAVFNDAYYLNGLQVGFSNHAYKTKGTQIGVFNYAEELHGIQIGLWNVNQKRKLPLINWSFKGKTK